MCDWLCQHGKWLIEPKSNILCLSNWIRISLSMPFDVQWQCEHQWRCSDRDTDTLERSSAGLGNAVSPLTSSQISVSVIWNFAVSANTREAHQKLYSSSSIHIDNNDSDIDNIIHPVQIPNGRGPPHSIGKKIQKEVFTMSMSLSMSILLIL